MKDKRYKNTDYYAMLKAILKDFNESLKAGDEKEQFSLLNKYMKIESINSLESDVQARYCRLLKLRGALKKSTEILEELNRKKHGKMDFCLQWELICNYLSMDDYEKAEGMINQWFYMFPENKNRPVFQTIAQEGNVKLTLAILEIARAQNCEYPTVATKNMTYYGTQIMNYNREKLENRVYSYFAEDKKFNQFSEDLTPNKVIDMTSELLKDAKKSTDSFAVDFYYFDFNREIGKDVKGKALTGIKVTTIKNTNDMINIEPYDVRDNKKIIVVNDIPVKVADEKASQNKVHKKSQIERFNRRYNKN